jgi:hypothetical protein
MRLSDLDPEWVTVAGGGGIGHTDTIEHAQGLMFMCPKCFQKNGGPRGTHSVLLWAFGRGVPDALQPGPGRWILKGTDFDSLTLSAPPGHTASVHLTTDCCWHGFITNGNVSIIPDPVKMV